MLHLLINNNKSSYLPTSNNKKIQKMIAKHLSSYYSIIKMPNNNDLLIFDPLTISVHNCKSKYTTRNKDNLTITANTTTKKQNNSNLFILIVLIESIYSCKSKRANAKNKNNKQDEILLIRRKHF